MLDLSKVDEERSTWITLTGPLEGIELEVKHVGPGLREQFRQRMVKAQILKPGQDGHQCAQGKERQWYTALAKLYILDWRGPIKLGDDEDVPYSPELMGTVFFAYRAAWEEVEKAIEEEERFFPRSASASTA